MRRDALASPEQPGDLQATGEYGPGQESHAGLASRREATAAQLGNSQTFTIHVA
jgi:hypothetical protein